MPEQKEIAFAVTHRPKDGVTDNDVNTFVDFCKAKCKYYKVITEKEGTDRHIHAVLYYNKPSLKKNVVRDILKLFPDLDEMGRTILRQGVKVSRSIQWLDYLEKGDSTVVWESNLPESSHLEKYYPNPVTNSKEGKKVTYYLRLERLWYEHVPPGTVPNPRNCRNLLFNLMYNLRLIDVIRDDKTIIQVSRHLARYINKLGQSCIEDHMDIVACNCKDV